MLFCPNIILNLSSLNNQLHPKMLEKAYKTFSNQNVFLPVSTPLIIWYLFIMFFMLGDFALTIIVICYDNDSARFVLFSVLDYIMLFILILDLIITLNTGIIKNGKILLDRKNANLQYVTSIYFYTDIIPLLMAIAEVSLNRKGFYYPYVGISFIMYVKLLKTYQIDTIFKKYVLKSFDQILIYEVFKNFLLLTLLCHVIGSLYFYIDVKMYQNGWYQQPNLWIFSSYCYQNIYNQQFWIQYTYSFYFAVVTLSGTAYGDLVPLNPTETAYVFCCFVFPMLIYSYVFSSIYRSISNRRQNETKIKRYKFLVKEYLKSLGVGYKMMNKIITYLQFLYKQNLVIDKKFMQDLAPSVREQYNNAIIQHNFKYDCFQHLMRVSRLNKNYLAQKISSLIVQESFPERFVLIHSTKLKIYYINTGKIIQYLKINQKFSKSLKKQEFVGMVQFYTNQISKLKYQSNSFVICHSIQYKRLKETIKRQSPILNEAFCMVQNQVIDEKKYDLMEENCYFCDQINHKFQDCHYLKPKINHTDIYEFKQERRTYRRKGWPKNIKNYVKPSKKVQESLLNLFLDPQFYHYLTEFALKTKQEMTQTQKYSANKKSENKFQKKMFQKVCNWDVYYPNRNVVA